MSDSQTKDDYLAIEAAAPVDTTGQLPRVVGTLQFIPPDRRTWYVRQMDGQFRLAFVAADDPRLNDYMEDVAAKRVELLQVGETPASHAEALKVSAEKYEVFKAELATLEKTAHDKRVAMEEARIKKEIADGEARLARFRAGGSR
jgi:hypothetical protein